MATAVNQASDTSSAHDHKANVIVASAIGALYLAVCLAIVFLGIPYLWKATLSEWMVAKKLGIFDPIGMGLLMIVSLVGLVVAGLRIAGSHPPPGLRAGVFTFVVSGLVLFFLTVWFGRFVRNQFIADPSSKLGLILMLAFAGAISFAFVRYVVMRPDFGHFLAMFETQGWFGLRSYKPTQGLKVRRLTLLGILLTAATGVYSLHENQTGNHDWKVILPFTVGLLKEGHQLAATLMPDLRYTLPLALLALGGWVAWRAVNYPVFADFLIATEAELNKVSWVTRKRLVQDTIVVLVTLVLFSIFLLVVDQVWGFLLTIDAPWGRIVPKPPEKKVVDVSREKPW